MRHACLLPGTHQSDTGIGLILVARRGYIGLPRTLQYVVNQIFLRKEISRWNLTLPLSDIPGRGVATASYGLHFECKIFVGFLQQRQQFQKNHGSRGRCDPVRRLRSQWRQRIIAGGRYLWRVIRLAHHGLLLRHG